MRIKIKIIRKFSDNAKTYLPGEVYNTPEEFARRWVSRGDAEWVGDENIPITSGIMHPKVSIVILVKDALDYVKKCIRSVNLYTENFELIIVDNGSGKETRDWLGKLDWLDFTLIINKENKGFSYGNNQAIKIAKHDYICFLNSDCLVSPNWLGKMMRGFSYSKDIGIVGPSTCHCATIQSPQVWKEFRNATQEDVNRISTMFKDDFYECAVVGFCFVFKKEVFEKIGVFDHKRYGLACHEDIDIVWRASVAGFKSLWCKGSYVHHYGNRTTREMGLDPKGLRLKNKQIFDARILNNKVLYVENDSVIERKISKKGTIPILMITWNRLEYTKKAIKALKANTKNFRLLIWDNASFDGTVEYLKGFNDKNIDIFYSDSNVGLVPPMNFFFEKFKDYRYAAKVDNDRIVAKDWLKNLKEVMDEYPLRAVEADHFLMLNYDIKENQDYYRHLYSIDFKENKLYLSEIIGGTGTIFRNSMINMIPEMQGSLSGWIQYQHDNPGIGAFYSGAWVDRLDQDGTNSFKESDYPEYDREIDKLRPARLKPKKPIKEGMFSETYKKAKEWYERL